ncbi:putative Ku70 protein [Seiridium cardinale]
MGDHDYKRESDDEDEDEVDENYYKAQKDALIFAIDVSKSMLEQPEPSDDKKSSTDSAVMAALKSAHKVMQQRIISNPKDQMGIILFGTEKTKYVNLEGRTSVLSYPHCYVYTPLDVPSAEEVKELRDLIEGEEDEDEILVPSSDGVRMNDFLFCANQIFTLKAPNFGSRRLFIITDNDDPHPGDKEASEASYNRAKDLYDLGVTIEVFPIVHGDAKFDLTKFYDNIIHHDSTSEALNPTRFNTSKLGDLNSLIKNINSKQTPKRAYFSNMKFELGPGLVISVNGYNVIQKQAAARTCYIWLDGEKAQMAISETVQMADDTAMTVDKGQIKKAYKFGGQYIHFSPEELKSIKQFGEPVIRIIGFKDRPLLKFWMSIKKSIFVFPSESGYVGSTRVFSALWQKLLKSQKVAIAWHVARTNANPSLVAIVPSKPPDDDDSGTPFLPAGLWLCPIPYADDVRPEPETRLVRSTSPLTDAMNKIVRNLQLPNANYDPLKYPNPALQWHYRILQALALEEEVPDEPEDKTKPKVKAIHKRVGGYIEDWSKVADEELSKYEEQQGIKRELDDDDEDVVRPVKRARKTVDKTANGGDSSSLNDAALKKKLNGGDISKLKVTELKEILSSRGLDTKGKKAELIDRLEQWGEDNL